MLNELAAVKTGYPLTSITWPYGGLKCRPIEVEYFWSYPLTNYQFQMIAGSSWFIWNMLCLCRTFFSEFLMASWFMSLWPRTMKILISNWPRKQKFNDHFSKKYRRGRPFLTIATRWSCSTSNFYALIGQNLTGELMRKIYAASWKLFTLTAKADRFFLPTCNVFNCLFLLDVQNEIHLLSRVFCSAWLVCLLGFWLGNASLVKVGNQISDGIAFVLLDA